jgi:hypothetical protein
MKRYIFAAAIAVLFAASVVAQSTPTVVGIRGPLFTINGHPTYTPETGFPNADPNLIGTLLNVRAVQALFDDSNYPKLGTRQNPYPTAVMGDVSWDYPDTGKWDPERNTREFIAALPEWRRAGLLAFTVNLQGGGPTDGNFGMEGPQPHDNSGFDTQGKLKPAYAERLKNIIAAADRNGMVVIVGFFYFGQDRRVAVTPDDGNLRQAIVNSIEFLKSLPNRNILVEINNEANPGYGHPLLRPNERLAEAVLLAKQVAGGRIPISFSWVGGVGYAGGPGDPAIRAVDYVMFHTNGRTPEEVHQTIFDMRRWVGYSRPLLINEDGVSSMNLHAAVQERVGWGYYDQGWNNYLDGYQSPPTKWGISTPVKWMFFEQVARLTGSPIPPMPRYDSDDVPVIKLVGLTPGQVLSLGARTQVEVIAEDRHPRWPIKRVEFFIDGRPFSYTSHAPFQFGGRGMAGLSLASFGPGKHTLRVVAYDRRGPLFSESCSMLEVPFVLEK